MAPTTTALLAFGTSLGLAEGLLPLLHNSRTLKITAHLRESPSPLAASASTSCVGWAAADIQVLAVSGLLPGEWPIIQNVVNHVASELGPSISFDSTKVFKEPVGLSRRYFGTTGRHLLLRCNRPLLEHDDTAVMETFQSSISSVVDDILYQSSEETTATLSNPLLVSILNSCDDHEIVNNGHDETAVFLQQLVDECIEDYGMWVPISSSSSAELETVLETTESGFVPSQVVEVDGAFIQEDPAVPKKLQWDTSLVAVFDDLLPHNLRQRLFTLVARDDDPDWSSTQSKQPNPKRWTRGGLMDLPSEMEQEEGVNVEEEKRSTSCWGLTPEAIEELCHQKHDAIEETETLLSRLFEDFYVTRLSEAVLGSGVSPLTANAPTAGDTFQMHIDADPFLAPPSPWTDVFGRYPNRCRGRPRFVSALFYLNEQWEPQWGANTRIWDVASDTEFAVAPLPGRCLVMDQDVTHAVSAPLQETYGPRYSLVWKLVLHPKYSQQDMRDLSCGRPWPKSQLLGSANPETNTNSRQ